MATLALVHDPAAVEALARRLLDEILTAKLQRLSVTSSDGKYTLLQVLGWGASSVVCRAHDPDLNRDVALKLFPELPDDVSLKAVKREARNLAKVQHPNVVVVHGIGNLVLMPGHHRCFYVAMELGRSLLPWLVSPRPNLETILAKFCQIGEGLAAIHLKGLVHRDFKPGNVVLVDDTPKIVDFGLAVSADADVDPTRSPVLVGTLPYMAPETLRGHSQDARSDQFSFAGALWHALCGELPYEGKSRDPATRQVVRLPTAALSDPVERALRRALQPNPAHRFGDMRSLVAALQTVDEPARGSSVTGLAPTIELDASVTTEVVRAQPRRRRATLWLTFPAVGALAIVAALQAIGFWSPPAEDGDDPEHETAGANTPDPTPDPKPPRPPPFASPSPPCPDPAGLAGAWKFSATASWAENMSLQDKMGHYTLDLSSDGTPCGLMVELRKLGNDDRRYSTPRGDRQRVELRRVPGLTGGFEGHFTPRRAGDANDLAYDFDFVVDGDRLYGDFHGVIGPGTQRFSGSLRGGRATERDDDRGTASADGGRVPCVTVCGAGCLGARATAECRRGCASDPWTEVVCPAPDASERVALPAKARACADTRWIAGKWRILARDRKSGDHRTYEVELGVRGCDLVVRSARDVDRDELLVDGRGRAHDTGRWDLTLTSGQRPSERVQHTWSLVGRDPAFGEFTARHEDQILAGGVLAAYRRP